jgi:hypothetical protein
MDNKGIDVKAMFKETQEMWDKLKKENKCVGNECTLKESHNYDHTKKSLRMDKKTQELFLECIKEFAKEQVKQLKKLNNGTDNEKD